MKKRKIFRPLLFLSAIWSDMGCIQKIIGEPIFSILPTPGLRMFQSKRYLEITSSKGIFGSIRPMIMDKQTYSEVYSLIPIRPKTAYTGRLIMDRPIL